LPLAIGGAISAYIINEYQNRADRSSQDLIATAQLALHIGAPHVKDLVIEAVRKSDNNAAILASAYIMASSAGWEEDPQTAQWIEKAAQLSGEGGPIQTISLQEIFDRKPEWDRRESETWGLLREGKVPIFLAARSLNRSLIDLMTFPSLVNLTETDPRRRNVIPAYSGKREPMDFGIEGKTVALDATALLTLSFLNVLDVAIDSFEAICIPHSTLKWLFDERQKTTFHQPSQISGAHQIRDFLATNVLEKFNPSTVASSDLYVQIGDELAALIAEAEKDRDQDDAQHIVVCPSPVYLVSSLMTEEANLSAHASQLCSCRAVVEKLWLKGQITSNEASHARAYLQLHEKPWANQPEISDGATLYLSDVAISYLLHLGLLGKLKAAGLTAVVSPRSLSEEEALISYERISNDAKEVIERLRACLGDRIQSGHIKVGKRCHSDDGDITNSSHPSLELTSLARFYDAAIIDDRLFNQHANIAGGDVLKPIFSTLDLLDALITSGVISEDDGCEYRTKLRRSGYFFVPVKVEELERYLSDSRVSDGRVVETAELKAIRESILCVRMSDWLQLPEEAPWLDGMLKSFIHVLRNLWIDGTDIEEVTAQSNWIVEQVDIRGWAQRLIPENADDVIRVERASNILLLLVRPSDVQQSVVDAYWEWLEEKVLAPLKDQFPEVYKRLVDWYRNQFVKMIETRLS